MREIFFEAMELWLAEDPRGILLAGDVGHPFVERLRERFGSRVINAGVAEQAAVGVAAGLALAGKKAVFYSIASFPTSRAYEFLRNDVCFHGAEVKIVAAGTGFTYGAQGPSHHALDDIALARLLPGMNLLLPGDLHEARVLCKAVLHDIAGPCYLRLGRSALDLGHDVVPFVPRVLREGAGAVFVATGSALEEAVRAAEIADASLVSLHGLPVLDDKRLLQMCEGKPVITVEEHLADGGIGSWLAERILESGVRPASFRRCAPRGFEKLAGSVAWLRDRAGISTSALLERG